MPVLNSSQTTYPKQTKELVIQSDIFVGHRDRVTKGEAAQMFPMLFYDIYQDIAVELPDQPNINIVRSEINKIIRRINHEIGLWRELIQVSPSTITTNIDGMSTTDIDADTSNNIEDMGRFRFGWDWSTADKRLRLDDNVIEVLEVYLDNEEWQKVDYEKVSDSNNSSEKYWSQIGRFIYFPKDLADSSEIVKIRGKKSYSFIDNVINENAIIDLPESYRQLLISGTLYSLTGRPKYKDKDLFAIHKEIFDKELSSLRIQYMNLEATYTTRDIVYKY
jgi:hypothetical protein|tara:strand:+ start:2796 stop:3626 length:831 start_codon:yes stop_codon:yes gene_type:complete